MDANKGKIRKSMYSNFVFAVNIFFLQKREKALF